MMTLRYVFSETGIALRRNLSMSIALIVTITVSLTLVGVGLLLNSQAHKAEKSWGDRLQISVLLCNQNSQSANCNKANVTADQKKAVEAALSTNPEVASFYWQSKQQAYDIWRRVYVSNSKSEQKVYSTVTPDDMQESYWVRLKDPRQFQGVESQVQGMQGVDNVRDLRSVLEPLYTWMSWLQAGAIGVAAFLLLAAVLQVANTIRLAALARRREIAIMRLVGASTLYISLPFIFETVVAALVGVAIASGLIAVLMQTVIYGRLRGAGVGRIMEWVDWTDAAHAGIWLLVTGVLSALVPTLLVIRKYLKV